MNVFNKEFFGERGFFTGVGNQGVDVEWLGWG